MGCVAHPYRPSILSSCWLSHLDKWVILFILPEKLVNWYIVTKDREVKITSLYNQVTKSPNLGRSRPNPLKSKRSSSAIKLEETVSETRQQVSQTTLRENFCRSLIIAFLWPGWVHSSFGGEVKGGAIWKECIGYKYGNQLYINQGKRLTVPCFIWTAIPLQSVNCNVGVDHGRINRKWTRSALVE